MEDLSCYNEWTTNNKRPSMHPAIRYCCGYVEHLCRLFDRIENRVMANILMYYRRDIYQFKRSFKRKIDYKLLERIQYKYIINPVVLELNIHYSSPFYDLRMLLHHNPKAWCYSMIRHILNYKDLSLKDQLYVGYWMMRLSITELAGCYLSTWHPGYYLYRKYVTTTFIIMSGRPRRLIDYPAHRPDYLSERTASRGLGCYVQLCEKRINNRISYTIKEKRADGSEHKRTIIEPFNDKFIRDIYIPLLRSNIDSIVICMDPLKTNTSKEVLLTFQSLLLDIERSTIPEPKTYIIIPEEHVNAPVGRNIMFSFIRTRLAETKYHWFGADDDDRVNTEGVNKLRDYILNRHINLNRVLLFDERFKEADINNMRQAYTRYAPWTYAFSPEYYNGLSYRCAPMEKEDLDFFNRLMQYNANITNLSVILTFKPSVYTYYFPNSDRPKHADLFKTGDIVDYINVHNSIESIDADDAERSIAPSSSTQPLAVSKQYYMNADKRYYYHEDTKINTVSTLKGDKRSTHYGIGIRDKGVTHKDLYKNPKHKLRASARSFLEDRELTENLNGDLYVILYSIATSIENEDRPNNSWGVSFQNGKALSTEVVRLLPKDVTDISGTINERWIAEEMEINAPGLQFMFESSDWELTDDAQKIIDKWNEYYIRTYRDVAEHAIPLRTFGGKSINCWLWMILLLVSAIAIIFILCPLIANVKRDSPIRKGI